MTNENENNGFTIKSERYNLMKHRFNDLAYFIKSAIKNRQPVIIRHHNDPDGITSGLILEHACSKLMEKEGIKPFFNLIRSSCKTPYYAFSDFLRDLNSIKRYEERGDKKPIVIVVDNGSTPEDYFALECLYKEGINAVVIDHHNPVNMTESNLEDGSKFISANCKFLKHHLNPYLFELDGRTCSGMLSYEIAQKIIPFNGMRIIPAVAGIDDRCDIDETQQYIKNSNKDVETLTMYGQILDFISFSNKMESSSAIYKEMFNNEKLAKTIYNKMISMRETKLESLRKHIKLDLETDKLIIKSIDLAKYADRYSYPRSGKVAGILKDEFEEKNEPIVFLSLMGAGVIIRQVEAFIPVSSMVIKLQELFPDANVNGGGHDCAGSIRFTESFKDEIISKMIELYKEI